MRTLALVALGLATSCGSGSPTYASCVDGLDCGALDICYQLRFDRTDGTMGEGNVCSRACMNDAECGPLGLCIRLDDDPAQTAFCAQSCTASPDCFAGFACTPITGDSTAVCLP